MRFPKKLFLKTFLTLFLFASVIWLLTRSDNGKVVFYRTMRKLFHVETVVVPLCSGLADQIGWYGYGEKVRERYHLPVKYNIRWFKKHGIDQDGVFARPLQLKQAFPSIELQPYVSVFENWLHAVFFRFDRNAGMRKEEGVRILKDKFHPIDLDTCKDLLDDINARQSCAVHVRRGDYMHGWDGTHPTQAEFFILAVNKIHSLDPNVKFFFFSEEPDWIREKVLPALDKSIECRVCDQNDSSKGYLDLICVG